MTSALFCYFELGVAIMGSALWPLPQPMKCMVRTWHLDISVKLNFVATLKQLDIFAILILPSVVLKKSSEF